MKKVIQQTFKYRLKPNKEQQIQLAQHAGTARFIYNWGLGMVKRALDGDLRMPSYYDLAGMLPAMKLSTVTEWLKKINSQVPQQALIDLFRALTVFFTAKNKKKSRFPKPRRKGKHDSFRIPQNVKCENGKVYLPKIGWVPYRDSRPIEGKIKQATIKRIGKHWYICIVCEKEIDIDIVPISDDDAVGIDVGISCYAATSNREKIPNPAYLRAMLDTLRYLCRSLSRKKKYSENWKKCVSKIQQLHIRIVNLRNDFLHKLSTLIAKNHGVVCVEDLNIKGMMKNRRLARSIADAAWGKFHEFMRYKCDWKGKHFKKIDRFFPSSKLCSSCGNKQDMPLDKRVFRCNSCGLKLDRDINASINILAAGLSALRACGATGDGQRSEAGIAGF